MLTYRYSIVLISIFLGVLAACQEKITTVNLVPVKELAFPLSPTQYWAPIYHSYQIDSISGPFVHFFDRNNNEIVCYAYPSGARLRSIPVRLFGDYRDEIVHVIWQHPDSIIIQLNAAKQAGYRHDSTFFMMNDRGEVKQVFDLSDLPVWTRAHPNIPKDSVHYIPPFMGPTLLNGNKLIIPLNRYGVAIGDTAYNHPPSFAAGWLNPFTPSPPFHLLSRQIPSQTGIYFPQDCSLPGLCMTHEGNLIWSLLHHSTIWEENLSNGEVRTHDFPSAVFDSIYPNPADQGVFPAYKRSELRAYSHLYGGIIYDPYRQVYLRFVKYPMRGANQGARSAQAKRGFIMFDQDFQRIGEGMLPEGYSINRLILPEGLALWRQDGADIQSDSIHYTIFNYHYGEMEKQAYIEQAIVEAPETKPGGWTAYLNEQFELPADSFALFFVPADLGCPSCLDYMIDYFRQQMEADPANRPPLYCVIAAENERILERKLSSHQLPPAFPHLFLDGQGGFLPYVGQDFSQGRLLLIANRKVEGETTINPDQLSIIPYLIEDFFQPEETGSD